MHNKNIQKVILLSVITFLFSCQQKNNSSSSSNSSFITPESGAIVKSGEQIFVKVSFANPEIDSVAYYIDSFRVDAKKDTSSYSINSSSYPLGSRLITAKIYTKGKIEEATSNVILVSSKIPEQYAYKIDKTLSVSTDTAKQKTNHLLANLEKKLFRAEKRKHEMALIQIENVKKRLFPNGTMQERTLNIAPMYVNYGEDFLSTCIENFEPLGGDFTLLLP